MAKIIVHIGLPKTATTTLQIDFFSKLDRDQMFYIGVKQVRGKIVQDKMYNQFYSSVTTGKEIEKTRKMLVAELNKGLDLLLSEEMIVVGEWQVKLRNLYQIIKDINHLIIITIREPVSAMFSYYIELHQVFGNKTFLDSAQNSNQMKIYHYRKFFQYLFQYFQSSNIRLVKFEDIVEGNLEELKRIVPSQNNTELGVYNEKKYIGDSILVERNYSYSFIIKRFLKRTYVYNIAKNKTLLPLFKIANKLLYALKVKKTYKIRKPSESELHLLSLELKDETSYIFEKFGINYL